MSLLPSDADLVARVVQTDDRHAFACLVRRHQAQVRSLLLRLTGGNRPLADDLAQEALVKAYRKLHTFRGDAALSTWLYRIAFTTFTKHNRKQPEVPTIPDETRVDLERAVTTSHDLNRGLRALRPEQRQAIALVYAEDMTLAEAADILGWPIGTLKTHVRRGKEQLEKRLRAYGREVE